VSRYPDAEEALAEGDFATAVAAYEQALTEAPADPEAIAGLARARLLQRVSTADEAAARAGASARPDDVPAQTLVADLDVVAGAVEEAFSRLIDVVRQAEADGRDVARKHLVDLFAVVGDDDARVSKARQRLASALF
jgi:putative thioredoxin